MNRPVLDLTQLYGFKTLAHNTTPKAVEIDTQLGSKVGAKVGRKVPEIAIKLGSKVGIIKSS